MRLLFEGFINHFVWKSHQVQILLMLGINRLFNMDIICFYSMEKYILLNFKPMKHSLSYVSCNPPLRCDVLEGVMQSLTCSNSSSFQTLQSNLDFPPLNDKNLYGKNLDPCSHVLPPKHSNIKKLFSYYCSGHQNSLQIWPFLTILRLQILTLLNSEFLRLYLPLFHHTS